MNLTWELRRGSVGRWCQRHLAGVAELEDVWTQSIRTGQTRRPTGAGSGGPDWARLGAAIHWRIALALTSEPPLAAFAGMAVLDPATSIDGLVEDYEQGRLDGAAPTTPGAGDFAMRLGRFAEGYHLDQVQPAAVERTLARAMWVLALWEDVYRAGPDRAGWWPGLDVGAGWDGPAWLKMAPDYAVADIANVSGLFTRRGLPGLFDSAGSKDVIVAPEYVPGWAEADLKVGSCLVEVEATVNPARLDPTWVWQLCCYAWLDGHTDAIAIHLARQGLTVTFDLDDLVTTVSHGGDPDVLAGQARTVMARAAASVGKPFP